MVDSYTKLLLHCDGADGSTTFIDSATGKTVTAVGNAQIDTAQSKFGGAAGLFDGTGDYITTPDHDDWDFAAGDFTVDWHVKFNALGINVCLFGQGDSSYAINTFSYFMQMAADNRMRFLPCVTSGGYLGSNYTSAIADSNWHHVAVIRYGNNVYVALDGVFNTAKDFTGKTILSRNEVLTIGRPGDYNGEYFNGWIDEFRVSKGIARWTADFTPPIHAYGSGGFFPIM